MNGEGLFAQLGVWTVPVFLLGIRGELACGHIFVATDFT